MRDGVMALNGVSARLVNAKDDIITDSRDGLAIHKVKPGVAGFLRVRDP